VPIVDRVSAWIDHRVMVTPFTAERTLTKDTVPVDVDAVLFWLVWDAEKAALELEDYQAAISWAAQTALREIIGKMDLADILVGREKMEPICRGSLMNAPHLGESRFSRWRYVMS
jgi:regulator of protease activity HflC (stomatin/prohibitin superfamily)